MLLNRAVFLHGLVLFIHSFVAAVLTVDRKNVFTSTQFQEGGRISAALFCLRAAQRRLTPVPALTLPLATRFDFTTGGL